MGGALTLDFPGSQPGPFQVPRRDKHTLPVSRCKFGLKPPGPLFAATIDAFFVTWVTRQFVWGSAHGRV